MAAEEHFLLFAGSLRQGAQVPSPWHFEVEAGGGGTGR
jgi:hypothetical protein